MGSVDGPDKKIKSETPLYRLVNDLFEEKIIERRTVPMPAERMRVGTFYRTSEPYQLWWFLSREQIEEQYSKSQVDITELLRQLVIARDLLEVEGCPDPQQKIAEDYKLLYNREPLRNFEAFKPRRDPEYRNRYLVAMDSGINFVKRKRGLQRSLPENKSE